jgi:hypothetical protein
MAFFKKHIKTKRRNRHVRALSLQTVKQTNEGVELTGIHIHVKQLTLAVEEFIGREGVHVKVTLYG